MAYLGSEQQAESGSSSIAAPAQQRYHQLLYTNNDYHLITDRGREGRGRLGLQLTAVIMLLGAHCLEELRRYLIL